MMLADVRKIDGEKVRIARGKAFLSQGELAEKAGVNRNTIYRIEKGGVVQVHPRTIRKVAEALTVDPASLTPRGMTLGVIGRLSHASITRA